MLTDLRSLTPTADARFIAELRGDDQTACVLIAASDLTSFDRFWFVVLTTLTADFRPCGWDHRDAWDRSLAWEQLRSAALSNGRKYPSALSPDDAAALKKTGKLVLGRTSAAA